MARTLTILFRRDPSRDRQRDQINYRGYQPYWPDGRPVEVGLDAFCQHGQRLLGLNRHLAKCQEALIRLINVPVQCEDAIAKIPGHRVRRFFLERNGTEGRLHFMDGTPTDVVFDLLKDEEEVLHWCGLASLEEGDRQWVDIAAGPVETPLGNAYSEKRPELKPGKMAPILETVSAQTYFGFNV